jgi:3-deoxy-D-manno-octulosonic-acid transferase
MYNLGIYIYVWLIKLLAFFNHEKAKQWYVGRKGVFEKLEDAFKDKGDEKRIWIHVASLGEFEQGRPLIEALKKEAPLMQAQYFSSSETYKIVLTFFSPSGYELRKNYPLADYIFYLPADTKANALRFIQIVEPDLAVFVKYEFWFNYLNILKKQNITTLLVSAIFRDSQFQALNPYTYFLTKMLKCFTYIYVQNTPSVFLLKKQGFDNVENIGDTRIDRVLTLKNEAPKYPLIEQFIASKPTLVGGSTWQPDEKMILELLKNPQFDAWKFILAPHDISSANIQRLLKGLPPEYVLYSDLENHKITQSPNPFSDKRILIIDNIGMLSSIYQYGKIAYIGGGFGSGIHNTLEPIAFSLPVIFGPKYHKFEEAIQLIKNGGGFSISNYTDFEKTMLFLHNENNYTHASKAAATYVINNQGATLKILQYIKTIDSNINS